MLISKFDNTNIESYVKEFEKRYSFQFPKPYRDFLLIYNGGNTPKSEFEINKISSDITGFYGFGNDAKLNFSSFIDNKSIFYYTKANVIPIADTACGDQIVIGISENRNEKIYFQFKKYPKILIELAKNFPSFIKLCKSKKIKKVKTVEEKILDMIRLGKEDKVTIENRIQWEKQFDYYSNIKQEELKLKKIR